QKRKLLEAAGKVLKGTVPTAIKVASSLGLKAVGLSNEDFSDAVGAVKDAAVKGAEELSEAAVEKMFDSYAKAEAVQTQFVQALSKITSSEKKPVVVLIDELDRCRPSFALEFLEQIKHLFVADNVVFVLFWNARAIQESIRHTYGQRTQAEAYLSKFVALDVPLLTPERRSGRRFRRFGTFVRNEVTRNVPQGADGSYFAECLEQLSDLLNPSLRDVQRAVRLFVQLKAYEMGRAHLVAYLLLLKVTDDASFAGLCVSDQHVATAQESRFPVQEPGRGEDELLQLRASLIFLSDKVRFQRLARERDKKPVTGTDEKVLDDSSMGALANELEQLAKMVRNRLAGGR
ncbi:MAG: P-loop NTPase fold protein, partial [Solirubrobacteraceae bacterium]|nr:P-loop NTPase fold protein [Solirubrobacteraceae bacterium]